LRKHFYGTIIRIARGALLGEPLCRTRNIERRASKCRRVENDFLSSYFGQGKGGINDFNLSIRSSARYIHNDGHSPQAQIDIQPMRWRVRTTASIKIVHQRVAQSDSEPRFWPTIGSWDVRNFDRAKLIPN